MGGNGNGHGNVRELRVTPKHKFSINLTDEAAATVRRLAEEQGISVTEVVRRGIALEDFIVEQRRRGAAFLLTPDDGKTVEKVHFVFG